jgi:hypothetical protein
VIQGGGQIVDSGQKVKIGGITIIKPMANVNKAEQDKKAAAEKLGLPEIDPLKK